VKRFRKLQEAAEDKKTAVCQNPSFNRRNLTE